MIRLNFLSTFTALEKQIKQYSPERNHFIVNSFGIDPNRAYHNWDGGQHLFGTEWKN